jgi:glyoxylase-like metal-dependent hydrolase (beta-lactamase superfamily II)
VSATVIYQELGYGITCIDTQLHRRGLACCYLIEHNGAVGFIDTGTNNSVPILLEVLKKKHLAIEQVVYLMPTHIHLDHAGGTGSLIKHFPKATVLIHPRGARHIINPEKLERGAVAVYGEEAFSNFFGNLSPIDESRVRQMKDGEMLDFNGRILEFLHAPGHAFHHYCIWDKTSRGIFSGDTLGASYPELNNGRARFIFPPSTPVQFDPELWPQTIDRLMEYQADRIFVTHFGMHKNIEPLMLMLKRSIRDYSETALELGALIRSSDVNSESLASSIQQSIEQASINYLLDQQCGLDAIAIKELIASDMNLNAQGLVHWLSSQN